MHKYLSGATVDEMLPAIEEYETYASAHDNDLADELRQCAADMREQCAALAAREVPTS